MVHSYSCSQMPAASVPLPSPLQSAQGAVQDGSLDGPPTADTTAAGARQASSCSGVPARCCPATHHQPPLPRGEQCTGETMPTARVSAVAGLWPESGPAFSVTGLHNPAPQEPAPVAAYRHAPSLTLDTILHRSVYTRGRLCSHEKAPQQQGP